MPQQDLYIIGGVTASGKSDLAIRLAKQVGGIIVNGDSRQVYKGLVIGSAQPIPESIADDGAWIINGIPHYLYGHIDPSMEYTVVDYQKEATALIQKAIKPIVLVGGSGLFIDSVAYQYKFPSMSMDDNLDGLSIEELKSKLPADVLVQLNDSDLNNQHRLKQAIRRGSKAEKSGRIFKKYLVISPPIDVLEQRINKRTPEMFENGLIKEVETLWKKYPGFTLKSLKSISYSEFIPYFEQGVPISEVFEAIKLHNRQYAKRQRTWFRRNKEALWFESAEEVDVAEIAKNAE